MQLKPGVRIHGLRPELMIALIVANDLWRELGQDLVVTSVIDGEHMRGSNHWKGMAADLRIWNLDGHIAASKLSARLGADFDVVLESDHIHVEYDPKLGFHE